MTTSFPIPAVTHEIKNHVQDVVGKRGSCSKQLDENLIASRDTHQAAVEAREPVRLHSKVDSPTIEMNHSLQLQEDGQAEQRVQHCWLLA